MFRITMAALLLAAQTAVASASAACPGPDPAIASVAVTSVTREGSLNRYQLAGKVVNVGGTAQAANVLQFVDIYQNGVKINERGIPPLKPGQSYTFHYASERSDQAGKGTTTLWFKLDVPQTSPAVSQNCNPNNDRFKLRF
ncbi:MAG: hypothetical protein ACYDGM_07650 [Vulcanimicrobiaceae bacterium]